MTKRTAAILALSALPALPAAARAQAGGVYARAFQAFNTGYVVYCETPGVVPNASINPSTCPGATWGGPFEASASVVGGVVRSKATISASSYNPGRLENFSAFANAVWSDRAVVSGTGASKLELTFHLSGLNEVSIASMGGSANATSVVNVNGEELFRSQRQVQGGCGRPGVPCSLSDAVSKTFTRVLALTAGQAEFSVSMFTDAFLGYDVGHPLSAVANANLGSTFQFTSYRVLDASGNDVTGSSAVTFVNGTTFTPLATVPEPTTIALVGIGLVGLAATARRRRG